MCTAVEQIYQTIKDKEYCRPVGEIFDWLIVCDFNRSGSFIGLFSLHFQGYELVSYMSHEYLYECFVGGFLVNHVECKNSSFFFVF